MSYDKTEIKLTSESNVLMLLYNTNRIVRNNIAKTY